MSAIDRDQAQREATRRANDYIRARGVRTDGFTAQSLKEGYFSGWLDRARLSAAVAHEAAQIAEARLEALVQARRTELHARLQMRSCEQCALEDAAQAQALLDQLGAPRTRFGHVLRLSDRIAQLLVGVTRGVVVSADADHVERCRTINDIVSGQQRATG